MKHLYFLRNSVPKLSCFEVVAVGMHHGIHGYAAGILLPRYTELGHSYGSDGSAEHVRRGRIYSQHRIDGNGGPLVTEIEGIKEAQHSQQQRRRMIFLVSKLHTRIFSMW